MDKLKMRSENLVDENIEFIAKKFPNAIVEARDENGNLSRMVDFDVLKQELSKEIVESDKERYQMTWPDKKQSILTANSPIAKTLRPCKEESVDFENTKNIYIEGDNLDVLKILRETYLGKVKIIYIDPPYNTGKNYIYKNNFSITTNEFLIRDNQMDEDGNKLVINNLTNGRFHTDWLNMMYQRLKVSKDLLAEDGVLICAIDENELATLIIILKEIFGESTYNFSCVSVVHNPRGQQGLNFSYVNEFAIFVYKNDGKKYLADVKKKEIDSRSLRDSGTESDRTDARSCFYPFIVRDLKIVKIGDVPDNNFHPKSGNIHLDNGDIEVWPINESGKEKKWRYARQTVETILSKLSVKETKNGLQIIFNKDTETMRSVWEGSRYDASEYGTKVVQDLLNIKNGFSFPKSLWLIYDTLKGIENNQDALILDFFSGSGTTAHASMLLNSEDSGNRKYIMVQVPEKIDENTEAYNSGYRTICDIGEERIRRAGKKIKEENQNVENLDIGFRVFKLDSSNMKDTYYEPNQYSTNLLDQLDENIKPDRTPEDLLFQVLLDLGLMLDSKIEIKMINGKKVFVVGEYNEAIDPDLICCFDSDVDNNTVTEIAKLKPRYCVFRDSSMAKDSVATNFDQIFETYSPSTTRKVL
mgnify:FL=1